MNGLATVWLISWQDLQPEYEALSYAWGERENPSFVIADDGTVDKFTTDGAVPVQGGLRRYMLWKANDLRKPFRKLKHGSIFKSKDRGKITFESNGRIKITITRNLDVALRHLRRHVDTRTLWIDALCIDQASPDEKSRQVAAMGRVYSTAVLVIAWLGPASSNSAQALGVITQMPRYAVVDWKFLTLSSSIDCPERELHWGNIHEVMPFDQGEFDSVLDLLCRPYFNRIWVRQEVALAFRAVLVCGTRLVDWEVFRTFSMMFYGKAYSFGAFSQDRLREFEGARAKIYRLCAFAAGQLAYTDIREYLHGAECEDPRDKIFAALSLLSRREREIGIEPDYSKPVTTVYSDVAMRVIGSNRSLRLLESCMLRSRALSIPSWVPDWSTSLPSIDVLERSWSACAWISSEIPVIDEERCHASGIVKQTVAAVIGPTTRDDKENATIFGLLRDLRTVASGLITPNIITCSWIETFCRDLLEATYAESYLPTHMSCFKFQLFVDAVQLVFSTECDLGTLEAQTRIPLKDLLAFMSSAWVDRTLFVCADGQAGISLQGVEVGHTISVLLGCHSPVILRPCLNDPCSWEVVSTATVVGLMRGEAVYGDALPEHWRAVQDQQTSLDNTALVDRRSCGMYDPVSDFLKTNPAEILEEMGFKVESYQREPHVLEVLPETLRAAGVPLQEIILV